MHRDDSHGAPAQPPPGYTLMFAGRRTAKTGLLRLLLDTLDVAPSASAEQAEDVAHFVKTASQPTTQVRAVTLDVRSPATDGPLRLTLVDTPAIDFGAAPAALETSVGDLVAYVEGQYRRSLLDVSCASSLPFLPLGRPVTGHPATGPGCLRTPSAFRFWAWHPLVLPDASSGTRSAPHFLPS